MGIDRNIFGRLRYTAKNKHKYEFSVTKGKHGPYEIIRHHPWYDTGAVIMIDSQMAFWEDTPRFDSFIQAVRYLKENLEDLL